MGVCGGGLLPGCATVGAGLASPQIEWEECVCACVDGVNVFCFVYVFMSLPLCLGYRIRLPLLDVAPTDCAQPQMLIS